MKETCEYISCNDCVGCSACMNICRVDAIQMVKNDEGFIYPKIEQSKCVNCGLCYRVCPVLSDKERENDTTPIYKAYYGYHKSLRILKSSSSGGVFCAMAEKILSADGVVFGAAFDYQNQRLRHVSSEECALSEIQKSKYVQSEVALSFRSVKEYLNKGRLVFFVGTPCQCAGLSNYLGRKDYDNLYICDFICHGVPSMKLLNSHIEYLGFGKRRIREINFRPKEKGWIDFFKISSEEGKEYKSFWRYDPFFYLFEKAVVLRKSCYDCIYSRGFRRADLTIADFWGYHRLDKSIFNKDGLSMIVSYSNKGAMLVDSLIKEGHHIVEMDEAYCSYAFRGSDNKSVEERDRFFASYTTNGYKDAIALYGFNKTKTKVYNLRDKIFVFLSKLLNRNK